MPDGGEHPLDLVLASLVEHELDATRAEAADARGSRATVVELDPLTQLSQRSVVRVAFDHGDVRLLDAVARVGEPVGELPVVREQEHASRVGVEPPDRYDAWLVRHELDDRGPPLGVARGRDDTGGLVEEDVPKRLPRHLPPVDLDAVTRADDGVELSRLAVDGDPAGLDQLIGAPTRGDPCPGEERVQGAS